MKKLIVLVAAFLVFSFIMIASQDCFTAGDFVQRRERLLSEVNDGVVIMDAALFPSEFYFLTGVQSRTAKVIILPDEIAKKTPKPGAWRTTLYLPPKSPRAGVWDDPELSYGDDARLLTGIETGAPLSAFSADVAKLGNITDTFYIPYRLAIQESGQLPSDLLFVDQVKTAVPHIKVKNLLPVLDRLCWVKMAKEIEVMRRACDITVEAFLEAAKQVRPGTYEYEIEAIINYVFRKKGSQRAAFLIIGSGPNSCILHHFLNDRQMQENELIVLDIGTVYCSMSTDLTRTLPVSGTFSEEQRKIYSIVLEAQKKAISVVKPGVTLAEVHAAARHVIEKAGYGQYFMHGTSHTLNGGNAVNPLTDGLFYSKQFDDRYQANDVPLAPGCMLTIEPGIYIPEKNLGIRMEDDILVTESGCEILTVAAPREIAEIEALMKRAF